MPNKERKQKYWDKLYNNAPIIQCACGCGQTLKSKDHYGRNKKYINGHNGRKYNNLTEYKRVWNKSHSEERQAYKSIYGRNRKIKLLLEKGGKCAMCGIEFDGENSAIFDFHHINKQVGFRLSTSNLVRYSWNKIIKEAEKCELLCSNCHRLLHYWESNQTNL